MSDDQLPLAFGPVPPGRPDAATDPATAATIPDDTTTEPMTEPTTEPTTQLPDPPFRIEVTRSKRRTRSVGAQLVGDTLRVAIPSWMSRSDEAHWVAEMSRRFARKLSSDRVDLSARAGTLARRHGLRRPTEIRWATDMTTRWGSCTPDTGTIRISDRIAAYPDWVVDYVIVHELAHLHVAGHGADFWELVHRFPRAERAIGYLIAKAGEGDPD